MHVFGVWQEARVTGESPHGQWENIPPCAWVPPRVLHIPAKLEFNFLWCFFSLEAGEADGREAFAHPVKLQCLQRWVQYSLRDIKHKCLWLDQSHSFSQQQLEPAATALAALITQCNFMFDRLVEWLIYVECQRRRLLAATRGCTPGWSLSRVKKQQCRRPSASHWEWMRNRFVFLHRS